MNRLLKLLLLLCTTSATTLCAESLPKSYSIGLFAKLHLPAGWERSTEPNTFHAPQGIPFVNVLSVSRSLPAIKSEDALLDEMKKEFSPEKLRQMIRESGAMIQSVTLDDLYYEEERKTLGARFGMVLSSGTSVTGMTEVFFVKGGYIQLNFYTTPEKLGQDTPLFEAIASKLSIQSFHRYNPVGASALGAWWNNLSLYSQFGVLCMLLSLLKLGMGMRFKVRRHTAPAARVHATKGRTSVSPQTTRAVSGAHAVKPPQEIYSHPQISSNNLRVIELQKKLQSLPSLNKARLVNRQIESGAVELVMLITLSEDLTLGEKQKTLHMLREEVDEKLVAAVIPEEQVGARASVPGVVLVSPTDSKPEIPGKVSQSGAIVIFEDQAFELKLE